MIKQLLIMQLAYCLIQPAFAQHTVYVDASNDSGIENGTPEHPFNTIKEGVANSTSGTTVMIREGNYYPDSTWQAYQNALYLKPGIALTGEGMANTIIHGVIVDWDQGNLSCKLDGMAFLEYHFARGPSEGPFDQQNIIRNCQADLIEINHSAGTPVNDSTPGPIYGFMIENNDLGVGGIQFAQGSGVANNIIQNNTCGTILIYSGAGYTYLVDNNELQYGIIDASGVCKTTISNNRIYNGGIIDKSGSNPYGVEDQFIEFNTITCNEDSPLFQDEDVKAAIIARPTSVTIRNNTITCSGMVYGIYSKSGGPFHVIDNNIQTEEAFQPATDPDEAVCGIYTKAGWGYVTGNIIYGGQIGYYSKAGTEDFSGNEISGAYIGFLSSGAEDVHHNSITNCHGDGMIMYGLRGPVHSNVVKDNEGSGIHVIRPDIDLGGGNFNGAGNNIITGNGNFDLYIDCQSTGNPVLYAKYNVWDHTDAAEIMQYDIRDGSDSTGLVTVDFSPVGYLGAEEMKEVTGFEIFPNPTSGKFMIYSPPSFDDSFTIELFDLAGRATEMVSHIKQGQDQTAYDISHLPAGVYLCRITDSNAVIMKKIVKCR
jgi:hypothetical protein